jgi:hypothetical protein
MLLKLHFILIKAELMIIRMQRDTNTHTHACVCASIKNDNL